MGNGEMGNGEWGVGNGEWGMGNGEAIVLLHPSSFILHLFYHPHVPGAPLNGPTISLVIQPP